MTSPRKFLLVTLLMLICFPVVNFAQGEDGDKSLSPYFMVKSDDPTLDQLPLKSTAANVKIAGVISDVTVTQVYKNEGKRPIEAVYVFPGSSRAAVYGMKMTIGDRTIVAQIKKKEEARQAYETAKRQGKSASLLEQERPNVFSMNVANILPGDEIKVEMNYTELLVPTDGVYDFSYPTVVGPRYSNKAEAKKPDAPTWAANPYLKEGEAPKTTFDMKVVLSTGLPLQEATCTSHKVKITYDGPALARIDLDESEKYGGNRDFILKYRLAGGKIESGLLLSEGEKENFFLLMVQPPKSIKTEQIPPREYIFIVDVSGSMHGFPLNTSKTVLRNLISNLRPTDTFNVLLFSGGSNFMSEKSLPATEENIKKAINIIDNQHGGGGTELLPAMTKALAFPRTGTVSRTMIIVTDGYVTVENEAFDLIRKNLNNSNLFAFGIGSSVNRFIIEGMARAGMGEPFIITKPDEAAEKGEKFRKYIQSPVLTGIKSEFGSFNAYAVEPPSIPDVLAERPVIIFGKFKGKPEGTITITGASGEGQYKQTFDAGATKPLPENAALRYLWARHRIAVLSDYGAQRQDKEIIEEVTNLGLNYNLLTAHTSFVAIDSQVRVKEGDKSTTVNQPLPLPEGVSNMAVGGALSGAPAPMRSQAMSADFSSKSEESFEKEFKKSPGTPILKAPEKPKSENKPDQSTSSATTAKITVGGIISSGGLTSDVIRSTIEPRLKVIFEEYNKVLQGKPGFTGKLGLEFKLDASGAVVEIKVFSNDLNHKDLENFTIKELKKLTFPAPKNGKAEFTVILSFNS